MSGFIDIREYSIGLFQAINKETNKDFAAKRISIHFENELRLIKREINILSQLIHPSIVKFFGFSPINLLWSIARMVHYKILLKEKEALNKK